MTLFPDDDWAPDMPDSDDPLWRYIDFTQFISILEEEELWFSAAAQFIDLWEGGITRSQVDRIANELPQFIDRKKEIVRQIFDSLRSTTYISAWHQRQNETAAMWELYNDRGKEVAIRTTVDGLQMAISSSDDLMFGCIEYLDYKEEDGTLFPISRESPFFHKRLSFEHEAEFRVVKSEFQVPDFATVDEDFSDLVSQIGEPGIGIHVDIADLIDEVVISPVAPKWLTGLVSEVLETYKLEDEIPVRESELIEDPFE